jgi:hypothetical protein
VAADRARLTITRQLAGEDCQFQISETDSDGLFKITGLTSGNYDIVACTQDGFVGTRSNISLGSGEETREIVIQVSSGSRLTVSNRIPASYGQVTIYSGDICVVAEGLAGGTVKAFAVPPGTVRVRLHQDQQPDQVREVSLGVAEEQTVVFGNDG